VSKNILLNDINYNGVSTVKLPTSDGGTAIFKDVDEIETPSGGDDAKFLEILISYDKVVMDEDIHLTVPSGIKCLRPYIFGNMTKDSSKGFMYIDLPNTIEKIYDHAFYFNTRAVIDELPPNLKEIHGHVFAWATNIFGSKTSLDIPATVETLAELAFYQYSGAVNTLTFKGKPNSIANNALQCNKFTTINVPWAEGEVANAPWGATSATINYNYTG
jgi:hypothetical protein